MAQLPVLLAFRARMKKRGYRDIHITVLHHLDSPDTYLVDAVEPLADFRVQREVGLDFIVHAFRF